MSFSETQIVDSIETGLRQTTGDAKLHVSGIECEDVDWHGMSGNTFVLVAAKVSGADGEQSVPLVIKRWAPGGVTGLLMGIEDIPSESLAWTAGLISSESLPTGFDVPIVATLDEPTSDNHWLIMRDVSADLERFSSPCDTAELHRRYSVVLDGLAAMHALWEQPSNQRLLQHHNWLLSDSSRLSRMDVYCRFFAGRALDEAESARVEAAMVFIERENLKPAREAFMDTLSASERDVWEKHECDRQALIVAFADLPTTLVHGDYFPPNVGIRESETGTVVVLIDWEWIGNGCGALDVAKLLTEGAALRLSDFDGDGLADYYFCQYQIHGGTAFDEQTWRRAYELSEIYYALSVHPYYTGLAIRGDSDSRAILEAKTARLTELMVQHLGR